jgi:formamidopyrimidine-DNA glycosylase
MPELPEVETTKQGITPLLINQPIVGVTVRQQQLRLPVTPNLSALCSGKLLITISRRAKYLLLHLSEGYLLIHLGMSGHLRIVNSQAPTGKHDHIDLCMENGSILRYNDPRRFGLWLYIEENPLHHRLLRHLGPEPLTAAFNGDYLYLCSRKKTQCIKSFIMNNKIVVGVGNIYAAESLFLAGIHPLNPAGNLSKEQLFYLSYHIKKVLQQAIDVGGTTLRDFYAADGKPGYFSNELKVYGRRKKNCYACNTLIEVVTISGRNSAFCPTCQPEHP